MPRNDDFDDDDRSSRRRRDDDRPARSRRPRDDDDLDRPSPPRRRRRDEDDDDRAPRRTKSSLPLILGIIGVVLLLCCGGGGTAVYFLANRFGTEVRERQTSANNLRELGVACHNHHDTLSFFPNNTYDPAGKPLLSWRVHLLPYLGENALYNQFKLDEPWDGPNNRRLVSQMPRVYGTPDMRARAGEGKTYYRGFSHQGAMFQKPARPGVAPRLSVAAITDGTSNTIMAVEAGDPVEWTKPDDIDWVPGRPLPPLGAGRTGDQIFVLMVDGTVRTFRKTMVESNWRALTTYNGNEVVALD